MEKSGKEKKTKRLKTLKIMIYKFSIQWNASARFKLRQTKNQKKGKSAFESIGLSTPSSLAFSSLHYRGVGHHHQLYRMQNSRVQICTMREAGWINIFN